MGTSKSISWLFLQTHRKLEVAKPTFFIDQQGCDKYEQAKEKKQDKAFIDDSWYFISLNWDYCD